MNKKKYIIGVIVILLIITSILVKCFVIDKKDITDSNNILYELVYFDDYIPGSKYEISIFENKIKIMETKFCSAVDCEPSVEDYQYKYSKENMDKLKRFIEKLDSKLLNQAAILPQDLNEYQEDVITGIINGEYFFEVAVEEYKYKIEYSESNNLSYDIYFKEDDSILAKKLNINNDYDITNIDTYEIKFSKENMRILNDYVEKLVSQEGNKVINKVSPLYKDERNIVASIIENNEDYLVNEKIVEIAYEISYKGLNCLTPKLILYTDNTFEYYYAYTSNYESLKVKEGTYNYDNMALWLGSSSEEGKYDVTTDLSIYDKNSNHYYNYDRDSLRKFLSDNNINLSTCLIP